MPKLRNTKIIKTQLMFISVCQRYGLGVPARPVYVTIAKLSAQQPSRKRPARVDAIDQRGDQGKLRRTYLDDS